MAISELQLPPGVRACTHDAAGPMAQALAVRVADALREAIAVRGQATLVVSGGRSPVSFFEALAQQDLPWAQVRVSLADERWVPVNHAGSNEGLVRRHLLQGPAAEAHFIGLYQVAGNLIKTDEMRLGRRPLQQMTTHQSFVAARMVDRYPALVGQADPHLRPGQILLRQRLEERHRTAPAGHHQGRLTANGDGLTQGISHAHGQRLSHWSGSVMRTGPDAWRQLQFRDRHTSSCHHG